MGITGYVLSVALADLGVHAAFVRARALWPAVMLRPAGGRAGDAGLQHPHDPDDGVLVDHERVRPLYGHGPTSAWMPTASTPCRTKMPTILSLVSSIFHGGVAVFRRLRGAGQPA